MKLVIGGSSGFLGTELVRQALANPTVTSIIGLSRRETAVPDGSSDPNGKLQSVVCGDFENYSDSIKQQVAGADACIWTIAVTPTKSHEVSWEEQCRVSRDYAVAAVKQVSSGREGSAKPFRFVYVSGHFAQRKGDPTPQLIKDQGMEHAVQMRGEAEELILDFVNKSQGSIEAGIARPAIITTEGVTSPVPGLPEVDLADMAAALISQVLGGFEKEILSNDDLGRIGQQARK